MEKKKIIITRHEGLVKALNKMGVEGEIIPHLNLSDFGEDLRGYTFYGVFPIPLAEELLHRGARVVLTTLNLTPNQRGKELSVEETLNALVVREIISLTTKPVQLGQADGGDKQ